MSCNFDFLADEFPILSSYGNQADGYRKSDPNSALIKVGMIGESIVNLIYDYMGTALPSDQKAVSKIDKLAREGYLPKQVTNLLHEMRKARNKAVHSGYESPTLRTPSCVWRTASASGSPCRSARGNTSLSST